MKILFRVDAGGKVGLGHFYRSVTLARKLREDGHEVIFSFLESPFWSARLEAGFDFLVKPLHEAEAEEATCSYIASHDVDIYYVDAILDFSYGFIERLREISKVVFYQNMSASGPRADVFIYPSSRVNQDFFGQFDSRPMVFRGLEYVVFHPDISLLPMKGRFAGGVHNVAVSAGGTDPLDTLRRIYGVVRNDIFKAYRFVFFYGSDYAFKNAIPRDLPSNVEFREFDHGEILRADVLLTAFGVSTYEFLSLGMPVIAYGHQASNAIASDELAQSTGALISLGEIGAVNQDGIADALLQLSRPEFRAEMLQRASRAIDMDGVRRVAAVLQTACGPR
ncbi:hypothetical protein [Zoogloea sp.]|uniref:hypothetical protein n=1 Tax=Zoogloea sp. TaxID=49181 RepID=UPI002603098F|nr:hypothetical protein [Zoogloea sp.]MDD3352761.1 hypothetical protein [Zoogloea sp.]